MAYFSTTEIVLKYDISLKTQGCKVAYLDAVRQQDIYSGPTVKQHLAALRMLFGHLVTGHVLEINAAASVHGPKYYIKKGKTSVLSADEARLLLNSIPVRMAAAVRFWSGCGIGP